MEHKPTYEELEKRVKELEKEMAKRKQAEKALLESEERYRTILESIDEGYYEVDFKGNFTFVNDSMCRIRGSSRDELIGVNNRKYMDPKTAKRVYRNFNKVYRTGKPVKGIAWESMRKDGTKRYVESSASLMKDSNGKPVGFRGIVADITERKIAEEALRKSEEKYRDLFENGSDLLCFHDLEGNLIDTNLAFKEEYGWVDEELANMNIRDLIPERYKHQFKDYLKRMTEKGKDEGLMKVIAKDGREMIIEYKNSLIYNETGPIGVQGSARDITERKQTERALKESEEKFKALFEFAPDAYYLNDLTGKFINGNKAAEDLMGFKREELIGKNFLELDLLPPEDLPKAAKLLTKNLEGSPTGPDEFVLSRKDGRRVWVEIRTFPINIQGQDIVLGIARDISDRKRMEEEFLRIQRMEAIATLAGGIAHEFNNALTSIVGNIQLLEMDFADNKAVKKYTEAMMPSSRRMANLTSQLLAYARGGSYQAKTISLSDFVEETLPVIEPNIGPYIHIDTDLPRDIFKVNIDSAQMQMVLSAVVSNSSEALGGDGRIRVITSNEEIDAEFAKSQPELRPGRFVCLTVEDYGEGMDEETVNKIFDPFYTTKFMGRGLGMAAAYGIIRNHGGWISVDSEQYKGTVVRIYLPAIEAEKKVKKEIITEPKIDIAEGECTVLIIEDEDMVMNVTRAVLVRLGYHILEAKTGKEAIEIAKTFDGQIDLALLDIKLPDIQGDKVYPLIMKARPNLKVIVCSGYSIDTAQGILDAGAQDFIQKPFSIETLSKKFKKVLES